MLMVQRVQDAEEAQRWKRKFLDALEEHEQREKILSARIRLLRRGLLGISLAGDGHDSRLDKQLAELRNSLRHDDRETGLERLLEQIEQSIVRLDNEKNASGWALQQAFQSALAELAQLPLSGAKRRQLKKFSSDLSVRLQDPQQHAGLIRQFVDLLRDIIQLMQTELIQAQEQQRRQEGPGFWSKLFRTSAPEDVETSTESASADSRSEAQVRVDSERAASRTLDSHEDQEQQQPTQHLSDTVQTEPTAPPADSAPETVVTPEETVLQHDVPEDTSLDVPDDELLSQPESEILEGELIRDKSGLAEPAFSFIAGHVEPLLLRILESIHITGESVELAESIRRNVVKGLNWYDFVAVLEQILMVLRNAADEQRAEFQGFLSEVNESLAQVQAFVDNSRRHSQLAADTDADMDARVREQIAGIKSVVESDDADLNTLKISVQNQIGAIIRSLDGFKSQRLSQDELLAAEMSKLTDRITSLEHESRELRLHLARQQENALKDSLTELPNREAYILRINQLLEKWRHKEGHGVDDERTLCVAVADVDFFKNINDTYGHLAGDKVLKIIARELISRLRERDFVARFGGEEFVILMPDTRPADAEYVLNKLREAIAAIPFHFKERQIQITLSFGVVAAATKDTVESLFDRADQALYLAKQAGRNKVYRAR